MTGVRVVPAEVLADEDDLAGLGTPDQPEDHRAAPGSLLGRLRSRAAQLQRERLLDLDLPGWGGELVLRFRPLDVGQLDRFVQAQAKRQTSDVSEGIESMATMCVGVFGRDGDRLIELADEDGPVRIEHRLGVLLGMPIAPDATLTTREVVTYLFGGNAFALGQFIERLAEWMQDPDATEAPGKS
jgi:hypothetical protein